MGSIFLSELFFRDFYFDYILWLLNENIMNKVLMHDIYNNERQRGMGKYKTTSLKVEKASDLPGVCDAILRYAWMGACMQEWGMSECLFKRMQSSRSGIRLTSMSFTFFSKEDPILHLLHLAFLL